MRHKRLVEAINSINESFILPDAFILTWIIIGAKLFPSLQYQCNPHKITISKIEYYYDAEYEIENLMMIN